MTERAGALSRATAAPRLRLECRHDHAFVELLAADDSNVTVELMVDTQTDRYALELRANFPGFGRVSRTWVADDPTATSGSAMFAANIGADAASVRFNLGSDEWTTTGDAARISARFAPILLSSQIWRDGHLFSLVFSDAWERATPGSAESALAPLLGVAIPVPGIATVDKDVLDQIKKCGGAVIGCGIAALLKGAFGSGGACWGGVALCVQAVACTAADCEQDDYDTTTG